MGHPTLTFLGLASITMIGAGLWLRSAPDPASALVDLPAAPEPARVEAPPPGPEAAPATAEVAASEASGAASPAPPEPAAPGVGEIRETPPDTTAAAEGTPAAPAVASEAMPANATAEGISGDRPATRLLRDGLLLVVPSAPAAAPDDPPPAAATPSPEKPAFRQAGFPPVTFGPETRLHPDFPDRMTVMERATLEAELRTLVPHPYFGAVAFSGNRVVVGAGGYASLKAAEAAVMARCEARGERCRIGARFLPEGFDGQRTGTLSWSQSETWQEFLSVPLQSSTVMRIYRVFAWSEDGAAVSTEMPSEDGASRMGLLRCDVARRVPDRPLVPGGSGCQIGAIRGP